MTVSIDSGAGFCAGVIRAIGRAEQTLRDSSTLYSLGAIVHNEEELSRLESCGLVTVDDISDIPDPRGASVLVRAHGEPPALYRRAAGIGAEIIDCTCPVVLGLQKSIREAYTRAHESSPAGQIVIFGKVGHPEVLGLVGQVDGDALVVENVSSLMAATAGGRLDLSRPVEVFSQTTMSPSGYESLCEALRREMKSTVKVHDTICRQVATRHKALAQFAASHDVIVFVAGGASSNGKVLYDLCRGINNATYLVASSQEVNPAWFASCSSVGVSGATSTPSWLLEKVAHTIENLQ